MALDVGERRRTVADHGLQGTDGALGNEPARRRIVAVPVEMAGHGEDDAVPGAGFDHGIGLGQRAAHGFRGEDGLHAQFGQSRRDLRARLGPGGQADHVDRFLLDHLPIVGVQGRTAPAPPEISEFGGVLVRGGHEVDPPGLHHRGCVGPRPGVVGLTDVLVVDGAAHPPAADHGAAIGMLRCGGPHGLKGFVSRIRHGMHFLGNQRSDLMVVGNPKMSLDPAQAGIHPIQAGVYIDAFRVRTSENFTFISVRTSENFTFISVRNVL